MDNIVIKIKEHPQLPREDCVKKDVEGWRGSEAYFIIIINSNMTIINRKYKRNSER